MARELILKGDYIQQNCVQALQCYTEDYLMTRRNVCGYIGWKIKVKINKFGMIALVLKIYTKNYLHEIHNWHHI